MSAELGDDRLLALYRRGVRLVGALAIDRPGQIMKYRRMISGRARWDEALDFASRGASTSAPPASALLGRGA